MMNPEEKLKNILDKKPLKIALAESCTGGLIASRITDIAGASEYFEAGVVSYSNKAKEFFLGVPAETIAMNGAVSEETARMMARGIRTAAQVDIGLSVTGIAGPGGATPDKPVGTVFIAIAAERNELVKKYLFTGTRREIKEQTANMALQMLIECVGEKEAS
jgi:PncC family amidohydrolase